MLYHIEKRQSKISSSIITCLGPPWPADLSQWTLQGSFPTLTPLPTEDHVTVRLVRCCMMHRLQAETKKPLLSLTWGELFPHKAISLTTSCVSSLAISKEALQTHSQPILLTWLSGSQETAWTRPHSPTFLYINRKMISGKPRVKLIVNSWAIGT